jgi:hypothetical protein
VLLSGPARYPVISGELLDFSKEAVPECTVDKLSALNGK